MDSKNTKTTASTNFNIQNIGAACGLRKAISPLGIIAIIVNLIAVALVFAWALMCSAINNGMSGEQIKGTVETLSGIVVLLAKVSKITVIASIVLDFVVCGLMFAESIVTGVNIRKQHLKSELPTVCVKGIVSILLLVFVILSLVGVLGGNSWSEQGELYNKTWVGFGEKTHKILGYLGLSFALVVFIRMYAKSFEKSFYKKLDSNDKLSKALVYSNLENAICMLLPAGLAIAGGFIGWTYIEPSQQSPNILTLVKDGVYWGGMYLSQFVVPMLAIIAFSALLQVGIPFLKSNNKDKVKLAIIWGVLGVVALVFFIINAVFLKLEDNAQPKWFDESKSCATMILIGFIASLVVGIAGMIVHKKFCPKLEVSAKEEVKK